MLPFAIALLCLLASSLRAEEQTSQYRIIGLFSPDRVQDLRDAMDYVNEFQLVNVDYENAQVTLRYDLKSILPDFNPKKPPTADQIEVRLDQILREASEHTFELKPLPSIPKEKLTKLEIHIGILDCKGCRYGAYLAAQRVEGVEQANVVTDPSLVIAWIDPAKTNRAAVEASLKKANVELKPKS
jgi:hypothetical protein